MKELNYSENWRLHESCLIKSIRRGKTDDALHWASKMWKDGRADAIWRRLMIHMSEDVGPAELTLPQTIMALYESYKVLVKKGNTVYETGACRQPLVHAVILLADARKSRCVDHAIMVHFVENEPEREIPDYCIDMHSPRGRREGKGIKHFFEQAAQLADESEYVDDLWAEKAKKIMLRREREGIEGG